LYDQKDYPTRVSRTLDPTGKSLVTVVGLHDNEISDADVNLIQDLQDYKRTNLLNNTAASGCLQYSPVQTFAVENTLYIPAFDVLFGPVGEVVTIAGNLSADLTTNRIVLPAPQFYQNGSTAAPGQIYIVFLEMWFAALDAETNAGYFINPTNPALRSFYAYGCVNCDPSNVIPDDSIDPFQNVQTTDRAQIQWRLSVQPVALSYDFTKYNFGVDPGASALETVWGEGVPSNQKAGPIQQAPYQFSFMGPITGDSGLWRSGDGNVNNSLGTMDGYSYAIPIAVVFQRNTGTFDVATNPLGCANPLVPGSGLVASGVSGRYDRKYADVIYPQDVVDTRLTVSLTAWDYDNMMKNAFDDLVSGNSTLKIARGESPGQLPVVTGSALDYLVAVNATALANTDTVGQFDGFANGFSSDLRTFYTVKAISVQQKTTGTAGARWALNDSFSLSLPLNSPATITFVQVQALVNQTDGSKNPVLLLQGQINTTGLNSTQVVIQIVKNLQGTSYDPGQNNLYVTVGVTYPAGVGADLRKVPFIVDGGSLVDVVSGKTLPVSGISDYAPQQIQPINSALNVVAISPEYSNLIFGTRVWITVPGTGVQTPVAGGGVITTFTVSGLNLNAPPGAPAGTGYTGLYPIRIWDFASGSYYAVASITILGATHYNGSFQVAVQGAVPTNSTVAMTVICADTCQLSFNAPVKGATLIEETCLIGVTGSDPNFRCDSRVQAVSVTNSGTLNTVVLAGNNAILRAISGDDAIKLVWVQDSNGNYNAVQLLSVSFQQGIVVITAPPSVNLTVQNWFCVAAILPAFDPSCTLILSETYVPYQGEGTSGRDYEVEHSEENALVTTNGTGRAPIVGLVDVYPFNRELPLVTMLPSQVSWNDATLNNEATASFFDSNYVAKQFGNVQDTFEVPLHTNDFIQPLYGNKRRNIRLLTPSGARGFASALPHVGFAIAPLTPRTVLGQNLFATIAPITLYVNNVSGSDSNDGLTAATAKLTIQGALEVIPPVLSFPVSIILAQTGVAFSMQQLASSLAVAALGDGVIRPIKYYALGVLGYTIQGSGRLVISGDPNASTRVLIDATGFSGFGDGPTSAFFIDNTRCIFQNLEFKNFPGSALYGEDSDVSIINCKFNDCLISGSWNQGCILVMDSGEIELGNACTGHVLSGSEMTAASVTLTVDPGTSPNFFFVAERNSSLTLQTHPTSQENNVTASTPVAQATIQSNIVCSSDFASGGAASISVNSSLEIAVAQPPFAGGVTSDSSSNVVTNV